MNNSDIQTWQLVKSAAEQLQLKFGEFRLSQLIKEVQKMAPEKDWSSIQPIIQGMTSNASGGPTGRGGTPFVRIRRGVYQLEASSAIHSRSEIPEGTLFPDRESVRLAGLHKHFQAGIGYEPRGSAESIVVSGGDIDDLDLGNEIIYTGQGGREDGSKKQTSDQELTRGNQALVIAEQTGTPIRVIRGSAGDPNFSPANGYRYDGLFIVQKHWFDISRDGPLIIRFLLIKLGSLASVTNTGQIDDLVPTAPTGNSSPERVPRAARNGIVRDPAVSDWIKTLYRNGCQICGIVLRTPSGNFSVGAHIHGLGTPHNGPDTVNNVLSLCPNCHALFDGGTLYILDDCRTVRFVFSEPDLQLNVHADHNLSVEAVQYHRLHIAGIR